MRHSDGAVQVSAVDAFDGEALAVSELSVEPRRLRFSTLTPSTGSTVEHELEALAEGQARYRYSVAQLWQRLPEDEPPPR